MKNAKKTQEKDKLTASIAKEYGVDYDIAKRIREGNPNVLKFIKAVVNYVKEHSEEQSAWEYVKTHPGAMELLKSKGLTLSERLMVRKEFSEWGKKVLKDFTYDHKNECYVSTIPALKSYGFESEREVTLINALYDLSPNQNIDKTMQVLSMILKMFDYDSSRIFNVKTK
jgi:hypothetical protein